MPHGVVWWTRCSFAAEATAAAASAAAAAAAAGVRPPTHRPVVLPVPPVRVSLTVEHLSLGASATEEFAGSMARRYSEEDYYFEPDDDVW